MYDNIKFPFVLLLNLPPGGFTVMCNIHKTLIIYSFEQGSKKPPSGRPGQVDFPFGQVTFSPSLPDGQGPRQAVRQLGF